jgi:hypothetical protein
MVAEVVAKVAEVAKVAPVVSVAEVLLVSIVTTPMLAPPSLTSSSVHLPVRPGAQEVPVVTEVLAQVEAVHRATAQETGQPVQVAAAVAMGLRVAPVRQVLRGPMQGCSW